MIRPLNRRGFVLGGAASLLSHPRWAAAKTPWPSRPIKVVLPSGAGGVVDVLARQLYDRLRPAFNQPFIVENRPGANGLIAMTLVKNAAPDGYTILHGSASATIMAEALNPNLPVKTLRDLAPIALTAVGGVLLATHSSVPARTLPELLELLEREPDKYPSYGSWGIGSNGHLTMEWIKQRTGITINHVPYKTAPSLLTDMVSGVIPIGWLDVVTPVNYIEQGKLRGIALNGLVRSAKLPEVGLMSEQGFPFPATGWHGAFAPKGTPDAILERMHAEINRALSQTELQDAIRQVNVEPSSPIGREAFATMVEADLAVWRGIVERGEIKPE
jgi:tripartite-type tricarboxylate transporter receptor subunit TctC